MAVEWRLGLCDVESELASCGDEIRVVADVQSLDWFV